MIKDFAPIIDEIYGMCKGANTASGGKLRYGTVTCVNPLSIRLTEEGYELDSESIHLTDNVIVKKVRMIVHRMYGEPQEIQFEGNANEVSNQLNALILNLQNQTSGFDLQFSAPQGGESGGEVITPPALQDYGISGGETFSRWLKMNGDGTVTLAMPELTATQVMETLKVSMSITNDIKFNIEFIEKEENKPRLNKPEQKQTTVIEGILWQGLKAGDICLMTSYDDNRSWLVHRIINRHRENDYDRMKQYEMGYLQDSRTEFNGF